MKYCAFTTTYNSKMTNCYSCKTKIFNEILQQVLILIAIEVYKYFIYLSAEVPSKVAKYVLTIIYNKLVPSLNFKVL